MLFSKFTTYILFFLFFLKPNSEISRPNSESIETFRFGGPTEMGSETKFSNMI